MARPALARLTRVLPAPGEGSLRMVPATVAAVSAAGDVSVDFGDGVPVPVARLAAASGLVVGAVVLVHRQAHSAVLIDTITPLGGS